MTSDGPVLPSIYTGRWVELRPLSRENYKLFHRWLPELRAFHIWNVPPDVATSEQFLAQVEEKLQNTITLLAISRRSGKVVGFVQAYDFNAAEGWCFVLAYIRPEFRRGYGADAMAGLLRYVFRTVPVRKVYADLHEFNLAPLKPLLAGGFVQEGRYRQHVYHDGQLWDLYRLAMDRDSAMKLFERLGTP